MANTSGLTTDNTALDPTRLSSEQLAADTTTPRTAIIRSIGDFTATVTVKEVHRDELTVAQHPVEKGASIADHAFKTPSQLTVQAGWSAAEYSSSSTDNFNLNDLYEALLTAQKSAQLMSVQTGRRYYENMLIRSLSVETDQATANVLMITAQLVELIIVETLETAMPSQANRSDPQSTQGITDTGSKSATQFTGPAPAEAITSGAASTDGTLSGYEIPLSGKSENFAVSLAGKVYNMAAQYRDAAGWCLDLADASNNPIVSGIPMVTGCNLMEQFDYLGFAGKAALRMVNMAEGDAAPTFSNLGTDVRLIMSAL